MLRYNRPQVPEPPTAHNIKVSLFVTIGKTRLKVFNSLVLDDPRQKLTIFLISRVFRLSSRQE
jgi:hypothetical protein